MGTSRAKREREEDWSKALMEGVEAAALDAIVTTDSAQRIVRFNPAAERIFGYAAADVLGHPVTLLMPERFREGHSARMQGFLRQVGPPRVLGGVGSGLAGRRRDGTEFPMEASISLVATREGYQVTAVIRDISRQVELVHRIEERERHLRMALDASNLGVAEIDLASGMLRAGDAKAAALMRLGEDPAGWTLPNFLDLVHPDDRERIRRVIEAIVSEDRSLDAELRLSWPDGVTRWVYGRGGLRRAPDGRPMAVFGVVMDIQEQRERTADTASQLAALNKVQAVAEFDLEGRFLAANDIFQHTFGYALAELKGRHHSMLLDPAERDSPEYAQLWDKLRRSEHVVARGHRLGKAGGGVWIQSVFSTVTDVDGRPYKIVKYAVDVTRQHQQEEQLRELSQRLLVAQEEERRGIARELHDQIGQSLTAALINLQMLDPGRTSRPLREVREALDDVLRQVRELSLDLRPSMLDGLGLEPALRWYLERQSALGKIAVHLRCPAGEQRLPPPTETLVFRLVQEATTNIVRHARARNLWVSVDREGPSVVLKVRDDGIGFDPAAALDRALRGGSFGLIGMKERAQLAGGAVTFDSAQGKGATVTAVLPLAT